LAGLTGAANAQDNSLLPLKWEVVEKPSIKNEIVVFPSEINRMAASHDIVYVVDTVNEKLHRSNNGGLTFTDISNALITSGVTLPIYEIAVAPDRPQYVAVVTNSRTRVYISDDSGVTWHGTGNISLAPLEEIRCITISNGYLSSGSPPVLLHDIAIGTADWVADAGRICTLQMGGSFSTWIDQVLILSGTGPAVSAVAFSPKYSSDPTILATASDSSGTSVNGTSLCIGARDIWAQTTKWNSAAGYTAYPMIIDAAFVVGMTVMSSIALPSDYDGSDTKTRLAFVGYTRRPIGSNDVYRIDDDVGSPVQRLKVAGGVPVNISSIAYYGTLVSGKLLAGYADPIGLNIAQVKWTLNPLGTPIGTPDSTVWNIAIQPPSGPGNALVAWSYQGTVAFCGTGYIPPPLITQPDESAFSQSYDNGDTWEQTSLINTILRMCDIAPAPDSRSLFMATFSEFGPEAVWRSAGEPLGTYWSRIYSMRTSSDMVLLRLSPDYSNDYTIYAVEADSDIAQPGQHLEKTLRTGTSHRYGSCKQGHALYSIAGWVHT
jgi:hypothetical protein